LPRHGRVVLTNVVQGLRVLLNPNPLTVL
jgi:hypothetical protein